LKRKYARARVKPVENDFAKLEQLGLRVVTADLVGETVLNKVRHDPAALADVVIDLASRSRAHQVRKQALATQPRRIR